MDAIFENTVVYKPNDLKSLLCQGFILTIYASKYASQPNEISLLEFHQPVLFYYNKCIYQLIDFCKYVSNRGKVFYCIVPNFTYRKLLFNLAILQDKDLAFAKRKQIIKSYYKIPNHKCKEIKFLRNLRVVFSNNIDMWYRIRTNTIFNILSETINENAGHIIIGLLKWSDSVKYKNIKLNLTKMNS